MDLFVGTYGAGGRTNLFYLNDGSGKLVDQGEVGPGATGAGGATYAATSADWNGDGKMDLFVGNSNGHTNELYYQNATTGVLEPVVCATGVECPTEAATATSDATATSSLHSVAGDFNGDGHTDLYVGTTSTALGSPGPARPNLFYLNDGAGNLVRSSVAGTIGDVVYIGHDNGALAAGDFNGDGCTDLYVGAAAPSTTHTAQSLMFISSCSGVGAARTCTHVLNAQADGPGGATSATSSDRTADVGDFDGDGNLDLFVATRVATVTQLGVTPDNRNQLWLGDGAGGFTRNTLASGPGGAPSAELATFGSAVGDLNADGADDVLAANGQGGANTLYLSDGKGGFTISLDGAGGADTVQRALGAVSSDWNGDGLADVFTADRGSNNALYLSGVCAAGFQNVRGARGQCTTCAAATLYRDDTMTDATCEECAAGSLSSKEPLLSCGGATGGARTGCALLCEPQQYRALGMADCAVVQPGQVCVAADGSSTCANGNTNISICSAGSQCPGGSQSSEICAEGNYQNNAGQSDCIHCPGGAACPDPSQAPQTCAAGTVSVARSTSCRACEVGKYQNNFAQSECLPCPSGYAAANSTNGTVLSGAVKCAAVSKPGYYAEAGLGIACPAGKFQDQGAAIECKECLPQTFTATSGQASCLACPEGEHTPGLSEGVAWKGKPACQNPGATRYLHRLPDIEVLGTNVANYNPKQCPSITNDNEAACGEGKYKPMDGFWRDGLKPAVTVDSDVEENNGVLWQTQGEKAIADENTKFYSCEVRSACWSPGAAELKCATGHYGVLCARCASNFWKQADNTCGVCPEQPKWPQILGSILGVMAFCTGVWLWLLSPLCPKSINRLFEKFGWVYSDAIRPKVKLVVNFYQVVVLIGTVYDVSLPADYVDFLANFKVFTMDIFQMFQLQCVVKFSFHKVLVAASAVGLVIVFLAVVLEIMAGACDKLADKCNMTSCVGSSLVNGVSKALFIVLYFFYPGISNVFFRTFNCKSIDNESYLVTDVAINCEDADHIEMERLAAACIVFWGVGVPLLFVVALFPSRHNIKNRNYTPNCERLSFFFMDYKAKYWYFEAVECAKKILVVGFAAMILKASILQLALSLFIMLAYTHMVSVMKPYRQNIDNALAVAANALLSVTLFGALLLKIAKLTALASYTGIDAVTVQGYAESNVTTLLITSAALILGFCGAALLWSGNQALKKLVFKYKADKTEVILPKVPQGHFHLFLSHQQLHGQDQVEVIKYRLEALCPGIRVFIDTDLSNTGRGLQDLAELDAFVENAKVIVFFLTRQYFDSYWCVQEMKGAKARKQATVLMLDTDPRHGGLSIEELQAIVKACPDCPQEITDEICAQQLTNSEGVIPWYRAGPYMAVSLKMLIQRLLMSCMPKEGPPPLLYLQNELGLSTVQMPPATYHMLLLAGQHSEKIKQCLEMHTPDMKVMLASGNDDVAKFKAESKSCEVLAVFGAFGVLKTSTALLTHAASQKKPVVVINPGVVFANILDECPKELRSYLFASIAIEWHDDDGASGNYNQVGAKLLAERVVRCMEGKVKTGELQHFEKSKRSGRFRLFGSSTKSPELPLQSKELAGALNVEGTV
jgi:hypothetical protein